MLRRVLVPLRAAVVASLGFTLLIGARRFFSVDGALTHARSFENVERARFLQRCGAQIPRGALVLALTESVPAPDFDYWLSTAEPAHVLARVTERTLKELQQEGEHASAADVEGALRARGALLDAAALAAALPKADYILVAELDDAPPLPGFIRIISEGARGLWRKGPA